MIVDIILSAIHIILAMSWVTFLAAQAALCRPEWLNALIVNRLVRLSYLGLICAGLMLCSGLLRLFVGGKPWDFYAQQWTLHLKLTVFFVVAALSWRIHCSYCHWQKQWQENHELPSNAVQKSVRKKLLLQTHIMIVFPVLGAFLSRGIF